MVLQAGATGREDGCERGVGVGTARSEDGQDGGVGIVGAPEGVEVGHEEELLVAGALPRLPLAGAPTRGGERSERRREDGGGRRRERERRRCGDGHLVAAHVAEAHLDGFDIDWHRRHDGLGRTRWEERGEGRQRLGVGEIHRVNRRRFHDLSPRNGI